MIDCGFLTHASISQQHFSPYLRLAAPTWLESEVTPGWATNKVAPWSAQKGQLGHGDLAQRNQPTVVAGLAGQRAVAGACGKNHTSVALEGGEAFSWGSNLSVRPPPPPPPSQQRLRSGATVKHVRRSD